MYHPSKKDVASFLRGTSRPVQLPSHATLLRHLLSNCPVCRETLSAEGWSPQRLARLLQLREPAMNDETLTATARRYDYGDAFAAADLAVSAFLAPELQPEHSIAELLAELDALPAAERARQAGTDPRMAFPAVVRSLIDRSQAMRYRDAEEMLHQAYLAQLAAEACSPEAAGNERRLADLRTRAYGQYGNALRVAGWPQDAEAAFSTAQRHRKEGTGDPILRAWLLERMTPLAVFHGRFDEAVEMCEEAGHIYQDLGESHLLASTQVQKAIACLYSGEAETAVRTLNQVVPLIDQEEDPHLLLAACHNLILCYIDLDRPDQALRIYSETRSLYQEFDDPLILLRAAWQEGQLLRDLGHLRAAETALLRARKGYMERNLAYEMALVSLDLATIYVKMGLSEELKETVATTVPIFRSLRVELETLASLLQLQQVAGQEQQALELIRRLTARIEPLSRQPRQPVADR